jgi:hypothetical protein
LAVANEFVHVPEIGEGVVARAVTRAFKVSFNPPLDTDGHHQPRAGGRLTLAPE